MNERAVADPIADQFAHRILPQVREVLIEAGSKGWPRTKSSLIGEAREDGKISEWKVVESQSGGHKLTRVEIDEKTSRSFKQSIVDLEARPEMKLRLMNFLNFDTTPLLVVKDVDFERSSEIFFQYEAGRKRDGDVLDPREKTYRVISTSIHLKKASYALGLNFAVGWVVTEFSQGAMLTNPSIGRPIVEGRLDGKLDDHGLPVLTMKVQVRDELRGEKVESSFDYRYEPEFTDDGWVYRRKPAGAKIRHNMPYPPTMTRGRVERRTNDRGRANVALIDQQMPTTFTQEQVATMFQNITEGKVFTAGVFSPREIRQAIVRGNRRSR